MLLYYAECRYAECRYDECRYAECCYTECRNALKLWLTSFMQDGLASLKAP